MSAYTEIEQIKRDLNYMGVSIDETTAVTKLVSSLPAAHSTFKKAWDSVDPANQTMVNLLARLKKEDLETTLLAKTEERRQHRVRFKRMPI